MEYAKIVDLSHWNAPEDLTKPAVQDWNKARSMGVVGGILRLGSINDITGVSYEDYRLREYVRIAKDNDVPIGYYWYMRPKWGGGRQLEFILKTMNDLALPMDLDFWIDVEEPGANVNGPGSAPYQARDAIRYLAIELSKKYPGRVGIYTRQNLWDVFVAQDPYWSSLKLWAARWYPTLSSPWSDGEGIFRDWNIWKQWQYSADGNGQAINYGFPFGDVDIDLNYYNGTEEDFKKEYNLIPPDPLAELVLRIQKLELQGAETTAKVLEATNNLINLQNQLDNTNYNQSAILEELISLKNWAEGINYKQ